MLENYVQLLADGFLEDPGVTFQIRNIPDGQKLFYLQCKGEIEVLHELGCLTTYGNGDGLVISYALSDLQKPEFTTALQNCSKYLLEELENPALAQMSQRAYEVGKISTSDWFMPYIGSKDVLIIQALVIHKAMRGTGLLTKMLEPLFEMSKHKDMYLALQTHNPANLPKYYHYGFKLLEQHSTENGELTCYNLLR